MRKFAYFSFIFSLSILASGCQSFDLTRFWKLNRGENYMNNDQHFSVPARLPPSASSAPTTESPQ